MRALYKVAICLSFVPFLGCGSQPGKSEKDSPTSGKITIVSDDEFMPLVEAELNVFTSAYHKASITAVYLPEDSAFSLFLKDSVRLIVASRKLLPAEEKYFKSKSIFPEQVKIATDAITFIVNNNNADSLLTMEQVNAIFQRRDSLWEQIDNKVKGSRINVVFDHEGSGNLRYIQEEILKGKKFPAWCFALHNNNEVLDYVSKNINAIGVIGLNKVSNVYDSSVIKALKKVRIVALSAGNGKAHYKPTLDNIEAGVYPLCRDIYIISRETYTGLGSGFLAFVTYDKGQRIVYREGLLPARMPSHTLHF
jgi:phosphate transport system substrate-binding protein